MIASKRHSWIAQSLMLLGICFMYNNSVQAAPVYYSGTGHWYEIIDNGPKLNWTEAKNAAIAKGGYLGTITSAGEHSFIYTTFAPAFSSDMNSNVWVGGFQSDGAHLKTDGWNWVTGEIWSYTNWNPGEPNDNNNGSTDLGNENYLILSALSGLWLDAGHSTVGNDRQYLVEWDSDPIPDVVAINGYPAQVNVGESAALNLSWQGVDTSKYNIGLKISNVPTDAGETQIWVEQTFELPSSGGSQEFQLPIPNGTAEGSCYVYAWINHKQEGWFGRTADAGTANDVVQVVIPDVVTINGYPAQVNVGESAALNLSWQGVDTSKYNIGLKISNVPTDAGETQIWVEQTFELSSAEGTQNFNLPIPNGTAEGSCYVYAWINHKQEGWFGRTADAVTVNDVVSVVIPNTLPTANAGINQIVKCAGVSGTPVTLDGSASTDPDGDALSYTWSENGSLIASGANPSVSLGDGLHTITLVVNDGQLDSESSSVVITVQDTTSPSLTVPADVTAECAGGSTSVSIGEATAADACDSNVTITNDAPASFPMGTTIVTWTATDDAGNSSTAQQKVTVADTGAPSLTVGDPSVTSLWAPNHSMVDVGFTGSVSDACDSSVQVSASVQVIDTPGEHAENDPDYEVVSVTNDNGNLSAMVSLRAERAGNGTGRIYRITFSATDDEGNSTSSVTEILVPHDVGGQSEVRKKK